MSRLLKVAALLKRELAPKIQEIIPPDFGIVSITQVLVQSDLKEATIYISCLESTSEANVMRLLETNIRKLQDFINRRLSMRYVPKLKFKLDTGKTNTENVDKLLWEINREEKKAK